MAGVHSPLPMDRQCPSPSIPAPLLLLAKQCTERGERMGKKPSLTLAHKGGWLKILNSPVPTVPLCCI